MWCFLCACINVHINSQAVDLLHMMRGRRIKQHDLNSTHEAMKSLINNQTLIVFQNKNLLLHYSCSSFLPGPNNGKLLSMLDHPIFFTIISQVLSRRAAWLTSSSNSSRCAELVYTAQKFHIILSPFHHENSCLMLSPRRPKQPTSSLVYFPFPLHSFAVSHLLRNSISPFDESNHARQQKCRRCIGLKILLSQALNYFQLESNQLAK